MGSPKGGGGVDTSGLEEATKQATALQKRIYEETREDVQPWYQMGTGAVGRLSDLLGVSGGSIQSRESIYNDLLPQYTTSTTSGGAPMLNIDGRMYDLAAEYAPTGRDGGLTADQFRNFQRMSEAGTLQDFIDTQNQRGGRSAYGSMSLTGMPTTSEVVDYEALNAAVDAQLGDQVTPDDYGSLLQTFGMEQFEADPGFQFRQEEANKQLERQLAAQGVTLGGAGYGEINPQAYRYMTDLNQNLAAQEYGAARDRYVQDQLNTFNMLMGASGMGQGSTGIMAQSGQNYATNVGNLQTGLASAQLNAQMAGQAQDSSMFGSLLGLGGRLGAAYLGGI